MYICDHNDDQDHLLQEPKTGLPKNRVLTCQGEMHVWI